MFPSRYRVDAKWLLKQLLKKTKKIGTQLFVVVFVVVVECCRRHTETSSSIASIGLCLPLAVAAFSVVRYLNGDGRIFLSVLVHGT